MHYATPTIAALSQRSLPISALKTHQVSDEHSGENLGVVREMFGPRQPQVSHFKCARELSPMATHPPSLTFASFSTNPLGTEIRLLSANVRSSSKSDKLLANRVADELSR